MSAHRLDQGGVINRAKPLQFTFDGNAYQGFKGDTIASALLANNVAVLGRSFKYHRPRGVWGAWVDEPNAIMNVALNGVELPNCLATTTVLEDGMDVRAVNAWPTAKHDVKAALSFLRRWLTAGFYYKTFMWPDWHLFEPFIRNMAGLGAVSTDVLQDHTSDRVNDACEVLVVGGGAAGLTAARSAAEAGQDVLLVEDHPDLGGGLFQVGAIEGQQPDDWISDQAAAITAAGGRIMKNATAFGVYDHGLVAVAQTGAFGEPPRLRRVRAGRVILASGALDRPLTFSGNDHPGVMSLFGAAEYLARYGILAGSRLAVLGNHGLCDNAAASLEAAGARILRLNPADGPSRASGQLGKMSLRHGGSRYDADAVLASGGFTPLLHLWRHAGGKLDWCGDRQAFLPGKAPESFVAIGAANGTYEIDRALQEAVAAGNQRPMARSEASFHVAPAWPEPGSGGDQWIDFQHDVTLKDVELASRENYTSVEHLKRYTTLGMAQDQGKTSNMAGLAAMAKLRGKSIPEVGTTTFRPPFVPLAFEAYHGTRRDIRVNPLKRLPLEQAHRAADAALGEYGGWLRPGWYGSKGPDDAIRTEVASAREKVGIFDASPLGKIDVMGPDAAAFLNFIYYNTISTLKPGHIRYGFMLTEGGVVFDDGVVLRISDDHFRVSCSSGHTDAVVGHLESWRQDGNDPDLIFIHDVTQAYATLAVTGPRARDVLGKVVSGCDLSAQSFPHMTYRDAKIGAVDVRIARVSFTGDLSYEISVAANCAQNLWDAVTTAAASYDGCLVGVEALSVLRAEKGYIILGKDTDGETMPHDLGFGGPRQKKKRAFVGDRSLHSNKANTDRRKEFVGLEVVSGEPALATGAHIVSDEPTQRSIGYVTSSYAVASVGRPIALALLEGGSGKLGETVKVWHAGKLQKAKICNPAVYDPEGKALHA